MFNHDVLHEGGELRARGHEFKYIVKTELLFRRVPFTSPENFKATPEYQQADALYKKSHSLESQGKLEEALQCYLEVRDLDSTET